MDGKTRSELLGLAALAVAATRVWMFMRDRSVPLKPVHARHRGRMPGRGTSDV